MDAILNSISNPSQLSRFTDPKTPYRFDRIFQATGFGARRLGKQRLKLMKQIDGAVRGLLADGEKVELVSWGVEYSFVEHYFLGLWAQLINRRALVFTNQRILILQINSRRKPMELKSQLRYQAIVKFARASIGTIGVVLHDGKKLSLTGLPRKDRAPIKELIAAKIEATRAQSPVMGREHLCPHCGHRVMGFPERCNRCARAFKSGARAGWLSLALPGLGDLYLGHRVLGVTEMLGALAAWGAFFAPRLVATVQQTASSSELALVGSLIFAFVHGSDAWITRRVGFKGIYPAE